MQSIYRFRKAEVSLFIEAWHGGLFEHIRLQRLQLTVNFRSTRPLVEWVNRTFPQIMPRKDDPVMGAVSYSDASTKPDVSMDIRILPERDDEEEASQVIEIIGQSEPDESIAILVRSRNHASDILAGLDRIKQHKARFRYQAINFTPLARTSLIRDLVSLTLALLQPADRLAWLATLRAPFIGLDLADLDILVAGDSGKILLDAIVVNSEVRQSTLSKNGHQRLQRTGPLLQEAIVRRGHQPVRMLVESAWINLGGPACVENDSELHDAATYFDLLDALEAENLPIDRDTLDQRMESLYAEPDATADGKLQVLTIYAAKGLQFDTVILPGLNRTPAIDKARLLHWFELAGQEKIVLSPMRNTVEKEKQKKSGDLIKFISTVEKQRQGLEDGRLLYVATTRAIRSLHLFAAVKPGAKGEIKPATGSLLNGLWSAIATEQIPLIETAAADLPASEEHDEDDQDDIGASSLHLPTVYRRLAADWQLPKPSDSVPQASAEYPGLQDTIEFNWAGEGARLTGNLVHRLLQLIGEQGLDHWETSGGITKRSNWCRAQLTSTGVREAKADAIIARATEAVNVCLSSGQGRWILENHEDAHCEYALTAVLDKRPRNLVLDRTFVDNGIRWIIDYKTSSHSGGDLEGFLANEADRYREQMQRYRDAVAMTETRPIKTALYFPLLDRLCEVNLDV
jgi:ATP-dependent exoDNAse (exonuclease V) beta subunit